MDKYNQVSLLIMFIPSANNNSLGQHFWISPSFLKDWISNLIFYKFIKSIIYYKLSIDKCILLPDLLCICFHYFMVYLKKMIKKYFFKSTSQCLHSYGEYRKEVFWVGWMGRTGRGRGGASWGNRVGLVELSSTRSWSRVRSQCAIQKLLILW